MDDSMTLSHPLLFSSLVEDPNKPHSAPSLAKTALTMQNINHITDLDATPANSIARSAFDIPPTAPWRDAKMR